MLPEQDYKTKLISKLNSINDGWIDGDKEHRYNEKVADVVNHRLKIALEIKDDSKFKFRLGAQISKLSTRQYKSDLKNASKKFENYIGYKTILMIRTERMQETVEYMMQGMQFITQDGRTGRHVGVFPDSDTSTKEVGIILFLNTRDNKMYFYENHGKNVNIERILNRSELEEITRFTFVN